MAKRPSPSTKATLPTEPKEQTPLAQQPSAAVSDNSSISKPTPTKKAGPKKVAKKKKAARKPKKQAPAHDSEKKAPVKASSKAKSAEKPANTGQKSSITAQEPELITKATTKLQEVPSPKKQKTSKTETKENKSSTTPQDVKATASTSHTEQPNPSESAPDSEGNINEELHKTFLHGEVPSMNIVHISSEMAPVSKVGGLADVVFGLTQELAIRGNSVEIILPKYDNMRYDHIHGLCIAHKDLWVPWYDGSIHCTVYFGFVYDRKCFFIEPHSQDNFFNRGKYYGEKDDIFRFAFFSRAAMEFLLKSGKRPDIIHCHDWHTGLVPVLHWEIYQHLGMGHSRICYTIHNFKHQGLCGSEVLRATALNRPEYYYDGSRLGDPKNAGALNLMKGGIVYSNFITTVSPTHAGEVRDKGQGFGLEGTLHAHTRKFGGILNGIDYDAWNPGTDSLLRKNYSLESVEGKYENKKALRERFLLADNEKPIIAHIGRLDPQKGLELVRHAIFYCVNNGAQFVLLGSSPEPSINAYFWHLKNEINENPDCHLEIGFNEELAHQIYAGADMMLVPSRFEPCGLTQLIAMRYGTIPVVRSVGGLADTVFDKDFSNRELGQRNGYVFENDDHAGVESALSRAISCYYQYPEHFRHLMLNTMKSDYSWNVPGQHYLNIYNYIRSK